MSAVASGLGRDAPVDAHAGFNKTLERGTLVGNWVEERQLEADTGVFRYKPWVNPPGPADAVRGAGGALESRSRPSPTNTHERVVTHADRLEPSDWVSHSRVALGTDAKRAGAYVDSRRVGPRTAAMLAAFEREASAPAPEPETDFNLRTSSADDASSNKTREGAASASSASSFYATTKSVSYGVAPDLRVAAPIGARVMYTQDGVRVPPSARDDVWRAEAGLCEKAVLDAMKLPEPREPHVVAPGGAGTDAGVTWTSQRWESGAYPDQDVLGTRPAEGRNPFNRNSGFSKPVDDPTKRQEDVDGVYE